MARRDLANGVASADLEEGRIVAGTLDGQDVVLVRHQGRVCALSGICTHLNAPLADGIVADGTLRCPFHHARFDLRTGEAVGAPAFEPLERFTVVEAEGLVLIDGPADRSEPVAATRSDIGRVVIIGGGAAGHACAEMLARHGAGDAVTVIEAEGDAPYDRTFCSKQYLSGKAERGEAALPPVADTVTWRGDTTVARIDRQAKAVILNNDERVPYDRLVLATGAAAVSPDFYGADRADVHVVRSLGDADRLIAALASAERAVVIGSSYIGLEVAASLIARGLQVALVSDDELPLEKTAGPEVGAMIRDLHESKGVTFHVAARVARWDGHVAHLDDGSRVEGDLLVAGVGAEPRIALAEAAGLTLADKAAGGGVAVDATLRTSDPSIHAIGDIASVPDPRLGHSIRVEHWVVAQRMGQWLARHLLGQGDPEYREVPFFWSGHYDLSLRYVGHVASPDDRTIDGKPAERDFAVRFAEQGREQAILTAGRDVEALKAEHRWEG